LPVCENNKVEYKSIKTGVMHARGHDGHIAIILGVAKLLQQKSELKGNIGLFFSQAKRLQTVQL
jgi:metal-dependent amidase/aminoacylase/carboxypeptidase family protein